MSTSAVSQSAAAPASPSGPPRGARHPQPRPTTYSGASPSVPHSSATPHSGPPIPPPPRTSSKSQAPTATAPDPRPVASSTRGAGDGTQDRDRRRPDDARTRQEQSPVARSNSTRGAPSSSRGNGEAQPPDPRSSTRRRQDPESSGSKRNAAAGGLQGVGNGDEQQQQQQPTSRRAHTRKETRFGEYILGQTLGEGEFGKVKLGWRRDGGVQVSSSSPCFSPVVSVVLYVFLVSIVTPRGLGPMQLLSPSVRSQSNSFVETRFRPIPPAFPRYTAKSPSCRHCRTPTSSAFTNASRPTATSESFSSMRLAASSSTTS